MYQLMLPDMEIASSLGPAPRHRIFFAILLPRQARTQALRLVQKLRSEHELYGNALAPDRLHVSLLSLGDYANFPDHLVRCARARTNHLRCGQFSANFDLVSSLQRQPRKPRRCAIALRDSKGGPDAKNLQRQIADLFEVELRASFVSAP